MKLNFLGGATEVGSLSMLLESNGTRLMLDHGLTPTIPPKYPMRSPSINALLITHAHVDHTGMSPAVISQYQAQVIATKPTTGMGRLLLMDTIKVSGYEGYPVPYNKDDVELWKDNTRNVNFSDRLDLFGVEVDVNRAGHIPGAAMYRINDDRSTLFTGDINTADTNLVKGTEPIKCDTLVMESTYAGRGHPPREETEKLFLEKIEETIARGGKAIVPAFAVGRTQEVLMVLNKRSFDVTVDGMGRQMSQEMLRSPEYLRSANSLKKAMDKAKFIHHWKERGNALDSEVIVSTSGMLNGGPALGYINEIKNDPKSSILLTGHQVEDTNGRLLMDKGKLIFTEAEEDVQCEVGFFDFSAHADHQELVNFAKACSPERIVLCHGDHREALKEDLGKEFEVHLPKEGEELEI